MTVSSREKSRASTRRLVDLEVLSVEGSSCSDDFVVGVLGAVADDIGGGFGVVVVVVEVVVVVVIVTTVIDT